MGLTCTTRWRMVTKKDGWNSPWDARGFCGWVGIIINLSEEARPALEPMMVYHILSSSLPNYWMAIDWGIIHIHIYIVCVCVSLSLSHISFPNWPHVHWFSDTPYMIIISISTPKVKPDLRWVAKSRGWGCPADYDSTLWTGVDPRGPWLYVKIALENRHLDTFSSLTYP